MTLDLAASGPENAADGLALVDLGARHWEDACLVAALLAVDPAGFGGCVVRAGPGPVRDAWDQEFRALLPPGAPVRDVPINVGEERLLGGLDIAATLSAGRPVAQRGLLSEADGGILSVSMAERLTPASAGLIAAAMDQGEVRLERGGVSACDPARFGLILFDESVDDFEAPPDILLDRTAFRVALDPVSIRQADPFMYDAETIEAARALRRDVDVDDTHLGAMNAAALALGVGSLRALGFCVAAARALAALDGRQKVSEADVQTASRLVLVPRALYLPPSEAPPEPAEPPQDSSNPDTDIDEAPQSETGQIEDRIVEAAKASLEAGILQLASAQSGARRRSGGGGKSGWLETSRSKGRPATPRRGDPRRDGRLDLIATLRSAAPMQRLRGQTHGARLALRSEDFRVKRFKHRAESVVIFVVDASGSSAMHRMAEAKGAVELLLADCYSRRDWVALIAFRDRAADLLLPPTKSLVRVRRSLAQLPGGGGTPLAAGLAAADALAEQEEARGRTPYVVVLSDGRGNIDLAGDPGRETAEHDAHSIAKRLRAAGRSTLFFDTSPRPSPKAQALCSELGAVYRPLPFSDPSIVSETVKRTISTR